MRALILGGNGYGGGELLRLLAVRSDVEAVAATSRQFAGQPFTAAHPHLAGFYEQTFLAEPDFSWLKGEGSVLFAAMPHGELARQWPTIAPHLDENTIVIDLSADFRIADSERFARNYGGSHPCPGEISAWTYGLPETGNAPAQGTRRIANPGCFATALQLALWAIREAGLRGPVAAFGVTGSSGSGATPSATTHHPTRAHDFRAYKPLAHQHQAEVEQFLDGHNLTVHFVPHSAPLVRGIFVTAQCQATRAQADQVRERLTEWCRNHPFLRLVEGTPRVANVVGTNFAELSFAHDAESIAVMVALDNLLKGMAGQAMQNLNLALGLPETTGLWAPAAAPG